MERVSLQELLTVLDARTAGMTNADVHFDRVEIDSRKVRAGDLFWAIAGRTYDGHTFAADAIGRGAKACVVQADRDTGAAVPRIIVRDTIAALQQLAAWCRRQNDILVIGVTGSVGKTTTREMIHAVLAAGHAGIRSRENFNNHLGVPLTLLELEAKHEFAVLEMGASAVGEIASLATLAQPEVGVITAVGPAHLTGFGSEDNVLQAKGELVESLPSSGFAVIAGDDPRCRSLAGRSRCPVILVGEDESNAVRAESVAVEGDSIRFRVGGQPYEVRAIGQHHLTAALCAIAVGREIGMRAADIARGLLNFEPAPGRCRAEQIGGLTVIDDTYNASPLSMRAACEVLGNWKGSGQRILIAGDMLELGEAATASHHGIGRKAAENGVDRVLTYGMHADDVVRGALAGGMPSHRLAAFSDLETLLAVLDCWIERGDVVLVKGSRAMRMERVIDWLRQRTETESEQRARGPARVCI